MWSDTFLQSPEEEKPRISRVIEGIGKYCEDKTKIVFVVMKSWNDNVVLYEYNENSPKLIDCTWLSLEEEDQKKHMANNNTTLRTYLSSAEDALFGCKVNSLEGDRLIVQINNEQLTSRTFELVLDSKGNPAIIGNINGNLCKLDYAYVQMKKGSIPIGDYMNLYGINLKNGEKEVEKILA